MQKAGYMIEPLNSVDENRWVPDKEAGDFRMQWPLDFLVDYIINVHHAYLRYTLPVLKEQLEQFVAGEKQSDSARGLQRQFMMLYLELPPVMQQEEEKIFTYIKLLNSAYAGKESFAGLMARTLRKPVEKVLNYEYSLVEESLQQMRAFTNNYTCSQETVMQKLREFDVELVQHITLETRILLPQVLTIENDLK